MPLQEVIIMARHQKSAGESRSEIPIWAERYARNRALHIILWVICIPIITFVFAAWSLLLVESGQPVLIILSIVFNVSVGAVILWMIVTGRLSRAFQQFTERLYRKEGNAVPTLPVRASHGILKYFCAVVCCTAGPWVVMFIFLRVFDLPVAYIQPAMAAVIVPILTALILVGPDNPKWPGLLLPALYATHAALALAGVRIPTFGVYYLDVFVPLGVYTALTLIAMHIYSRYALLRLRIAALSPAAQFMESDEKGDDDADA